MEVNKQYGMTVVKYFVVPLERFFNLFSCEHIEEEAIPYTPLKKFPIPITPLEKFSLPINHQLNFVWTHLPLPLDFGGTAA